MSAPTLPIFEQELALLERACMGIPDAQGNYYEGDYVTNVLYTVLDLQMHGNAVARALRFYRDQRARDVGTLDDLEATLARYPDDMEGNRQAAQFLWGNNHWKRVEWLRGFVPWLRQERLTDQESLRAWAHASEFRRDFEGRLKYLGIAAYKWLTMRLGVETVKPDVHLHRFVEDVVGHPVTDGELVRGLEEVARRANRSAASHFVGTATAAVSAGSDRT